MEGLANMFAKQNAALFELSGMDQNVERFMTVEKQINDKADNIDEIASTMTPTPASLIISLSSSPLPGPSTANDSNFDFDDLKPLPQYKDE